MAKGDMIPVESSNLDAVGYDPETRELTIRFKHGGATYLYENISPREHDALMGADSVGGHFHQHFKQRKFKKL